jgi:hypothetical protein
VSCHQAFFLARQGVEGNSRYSDRNIRKTCTTICHHQILGGSDKHADFSTCDAPCPEQSKTVTTPEIIDQIHKLILEDSQISAKSIAGHAEALRRVGPEMPECGSKTSMPIV